MKRVQGRGKPAVSKSNNRIVAWFENYWYYYKAPVLIIGAFLVLATIFIVDIVTKEEADLRFVMVTNAAVPDEEFMYLAERIGGYVRDVNGDGKETINPQTMYIVENPKDEYEMMASQQLMTTMVDEDVVFYIVDDFMYKYLKEAGAIAPLSEFGVTGGENDERILLNDTSLMQDLKIAERDQYYFIFKVWALDKRDSEETAQRYAVASDMIRSVLGQGN